MKIQITPKAVFEYAAFWQRSGALVVDTLITNLVTFTISYAVGWTLKQLGVGNNRILLAGYLIGVLLPFLYWVLFECSRYQATPGKLLFRIAVTDLAGLRVSFPRSLQRNIVKMLLVVAQVGLFSWGGIILAVAVFISFVFSAFTRKRQALYDLVTGCLVIRRESRAQGNKKRPSTNVLTK